MYDFTFITIRTGFLWATHWEGLMWSREWDQHPGYPPSHSLLSIHMSLPKIGVLSIMLASMVGVLTFIHVSGPLWCSGQDLYSQRKHVNISSPCCSSHHGNHLKHVFIQKAPSNLHVQTSELKTLLYSERCKFGARPHSPESYNGFARMNIYLPSKLCSHKYTEIQTCRQYWLNCLLCEKIHRGQVTPGVSEKEQTYHSLFLWLLFIWQWNRNQRGHIQGYKVETKSQVSAEWLNYTF